MSEPSVTIFVCVSCRRPLDGVEAGYDEPGPQLAAALDHRLQAEPGWAIAVAPVECLAVCKRPCTVAFSSAGKWTYLVGDLDPERHADDIIDAARSFARSGNGIVPWRERPACFRKGVIARVPPLPDLAAARGPLPEIANS